ncbi:MAG: DUF6948 domain-containing protein, partial [Cumulibacter sp.]
IKMNDLNSILKLMLLSSFEGSEHKTGADKSVADKTHATLGAEAGDYVICRTRNAGVICGELVENGDRYCKLKNARRIYRPISRDKKLAWYEGVAESGLCPDSGKISGAVGYKVVYEDYELTACSDIGRKSLTEAASNETSV